MFHESRYTDVLSMVFDTDKMEPLLLSTIFIILSAFGVPSENYILIENWANMKVESHGSDFVGIVTDSSGNIYLLENKSNQVIKFSSDGELISQWQSTFSQNPYPYPIGISVDKSDNIYINDGQSLSFEKFSAEGNHISGWNYNPENSVIEIPLILHVDHLNNFYVFGEIMGESRYSLPSGTHIKKFSSDGKQLAEFDLSDVVTRSLTVDSDHDGNLYLLDDHNSKIVKLFVDGTTVEWGSLGTQNGMFNFPTDIAVDSTNNVYVADRYNHRIQKFSDNGEFIHKWDVTDNPVLITVDSKDNIHALTEANLVKKFSKDGLLLDTWNPVGSTQNIHLTSPKAVATDSAGNVYVVDANAQRIVKFDSSGQVVTQWALQIYENQLTGLSSGIAVDSDDDVYVVDSFSPYIQKFSDTGKFLTEWNLEEYNTEQPYSNPARVDFDSDDNMYILDRNGQMHKFSPDNELMWTSEVGADNILAQDIAVDSKNFVYVSDSGNQRILKFSGNDGGLVKTFGTPVNHTEQYYPSGIGVDSKDDLYVVEEMTKQIIKYSDDEYVSQFDLGIQNRTSYASGLDMAISHDDMIYITTTGQIITHEKPVQLDNDAPYEINDILLILIPLLVLIGLIVFLTYKKQKK